MITLVIQHKVSDFAAWKRAFDADPLGRARNGVLGHVIYRWADDPEFVVVHLDFATRAEADALLVRLRGLWAGVGDRIGFGGSGVDVRILEEVEHAED